MKNREFLIENKLEEVLNKYPFLEDFFKDNQIEINKDQSLEEIFSSYEDDFLEEKGIDRKIFFDNLEEYVVQMCQILGLNSENTIEEIKILPGIDKFGERENFSHITIKKGEIISIVGPTGSGKSRLLADIEWGASGDTPTKREILIDGKNLDQKSRFSSSNKLVAELSQNMNFVMDLTVFEFLELHAKSRLVVNEKEIIEKIFVKANELAGEKFNLDTPITSLSGGQSRALMIADTAILSSSPIILIDEIENAGIDRKKALELLVGEEKIVLIATHDPLLALLGDRRIVIKNGGIHKIIETSADEKKALLELEKLDKIFYDIRQKLRLGEKIEFLYKNI